MRRIILSLLLLLGASAAMQADGLTRLHVTTKGGDKLTYDLYDNPSVKFVGDSVQIDLGDQTSTLALDDVAQMNYEVIGATTGVAHPAAPAVKGEQTISLRKGDNLVQVSTVGGAVLYESTIHSQGEDFTLPCELAPGVYVVKINSLTFKMMKR